MPHTNCHDDKVVFIHLKVLLGRPWECGETLAITSTVETDYGGFPRCL